MGGGPPDLKGQEFEVPTPASATPPDKQWALAEIQVQEGQESRGLVRGQDDLPPLSGLWLFVC